MVSFLVYTGLGIFCARETTGTNVMNLYLIGSFTQFFLHRDVSLTRLLGFVYRELPGHSFIRSREYMRGSLARKGSDRHASLTE